MGPWLFCLCLHCADSQTNSKEPKPYQRYAKAWTYLKEPNSVLKCTSIAISLTSWQCWHKGSSYHRQIWRGSDTVDAITLSWVCWRVISIMEPMTHLTHGKWLHQPQCGQDLSHQGRTHIPCSLQQSRWVFVMSKTHHECDFTIDII